MQSSGDRLRVAKPRGRCPLTRYAGEESAPGWSPDGRFLVFGSDRDGRDQLFIVHASGGGLARITDAQADKDAPAWR